MTKNEARMLLKARSALTSQPYSDDVVDVWHNALAKYDYLEVRTALIEAGNTESKIAVAHVVKHLPPPKATGPTRDTHSIACMCGGRGWIEVEQQDDNGTWMAWARCPNGPPTGFIEL